ncbi:MAG: hypothetical protein IPK10_03895 [Bacteroidetes bacterium]|nr:hypothetical protein [Bacteroidota bacterium]
MNLKIWFLLMCVCSLMACSRPQVSLQEKISEKEKALDLDYITRLFIQGWRIEYFHRKV